MRYCEYMSECSCDNLATHQIANKAAGISWFNRDEFVAPLDHGAFDNIMAVGMRLGKAAGHKKKHNHLEMVITSPKT